MLPEAYHAENGILHSMATVGVEFDRAINIQCLWRYPQEAVDARIADARFVLLEQILPVFILSTVQLVESLARL